MQELDLSQNKLGGEFPLCLTSLTGLRVLDLSSNQLTGMLPSTLGNLESLEYFFSLGSLANLSELKVFKLSSQSNSLQVESESSWKPKFQLSVIVLRSCNLENVPHFLLQQKDLRLVDLSKNKISGSFPSWLLENNTKLEALLLQNNILTSFQLPESAHNLILMNVSVNKFNHRLPENFGWILPRLWYMNLAYNGFQGTLPSSVGDMEGISYLDLSHNSFSGQGLRNLKYLWLLDISNNNFTGVIPSWIGECPELSALLLSNNSLEGEIPISLFNLSSLSILDLSANLLSGDIPLHANFEDGVELYLQDNNLSGAIPETFLVNVVVLDLRNNRLSGKIPEFSNSQNMTILLLRGNNLLGGIPRQLCTLRILHLLDLARNKLNGSIPSCLSNTSFGLRNADAFNIFYDSDISYSGLHLDIYFKSLLVLEEFPIEYSAGTQTKIEFATKHRYDAYMGENLILFSGMDLSGNELSGEIPPELGSLELQALNLSHNKLSGTIPETFSGLKNVESLDLSFNRLQGPIPPQLAELTSLEIFQVSYNNLSGVIPHGRQFNTFENQSYFGNPFLCGPPTNICCNGNNFQEADNAVEADESRIDKVSLYWSFAGAFVTILLGIFASLSFDSPWSRAWFYFVDVFIHKVKNLLW